MDRDFLGHLKTQQRNGDVVFGVCMFFPCVSDEATYEWEPEDV